MILFDSPLAEISYNESRKFVRTTWKRTDGPEDFTQVLLEARRIFERVRPEYVLWNQHNFTLQIPERLQKWTDEHMNEPAIKLQSIKKLSFVVSPDIMAQLSVVELFDQSDVGFNPRFFADETSCLAWLDAPVPETTISPTVPEISLVESNDGKIRLSVDIEHHELHEYLFLLNKFIKTRTLSLQLAKRYLSLSARERQITKLIVQGKSNQDIADRLYLSYHTIKTHRKNIFRKLGWRNSSSLRQSFILQSEFSRQRRVIRHDSYGAAGGISSRRSVLPITRSGQRAVRQIRAGHFRVRHREYFRREAPRNYHSRCSLR